VAEQLIIKKLVEDIQTLITSSISILQHQWHSTKTNRIWTLIRSAHQNERIYCHH